MGWSESGVDPQRVHSRYSLRGGSVHHLHVDTFDRGDATNHSLKVVSTGAHEITARVESAELFRAAVYEVHFAATLALGNLAHPTFHGGACC